MRLENAAPGLFQPPNWEGLPHKALRRGCAGLGWPGGLHTTWLGPVVEGGQAVKMLWQGDLCAGLGPLGCQRSFWLQTLAGSEPAGAGWAGFYG